MMNPFSYKSPTSLDAAVADLSDQPGRVDILAGGTDLLSLMKEGLATPRTVVNIKKIPGLAAIEVGDDAITIGATATLADIAAHSAIKKYLPALAEAIAVLGGPQIRNMGTLGGSLCQRNRDWYFRNGLNPEVKEETQYAAIFPSDGAIYVHPSTTAPPLIAYEATVAIQGPKGERKAPLDQLFQVATGNKREIVLAPNEILRSVTIPVRAGTKSADYEVRERDSHDWPLVQASVALQMAGASVQAARIVLGHVGPLPMVSNEAAAAIAGKEINPETADAAAAAAVAGAKPLSKNAYKVNLAQVAVKRALLAAVGKAYWRAES